MLPINKVDINAMTYYINPLPAKLSYLNFHPLEVVSRYRDPQLQVGENYSYLFIISETKPFANLDV